MGPMKGAQMFKDTNYLHFCCSSWWSDVERLHSSVFICCFTKTRWRNVIIDGVQTELVRKPLSTAVEGHKSVITVPVAVAFFLSSVKTKRRHMRNTHLTSVCPFPLVLSHCSWDDSSSVSSGLSDTLDNISTDDLNTPPYSTVSSSRKSKGIQVRTPTLFF